MLWNQKEGLKSQQNSEYISLFITYTLYMVGFENNFELGHCLTMYWAILILS